jgi:hypothetical protein
MLSPEVNSGLKKVDFPQVLALADYQWPLSTLLLNFYSCFTSTYSSDAVTQKPVFIQEV